MTLRQTILARISEYLEAHSITERAFGIAVCRDHKLVPRLRDSGVTLDRIEQVETFMRDHPKGLATKAAQPERVTA